MSWTTEHYGYADEHQIIFINYPDWKDDDIDIILSIMRPGVEKILLVNCGIRMKFIDKILSKIIEIGSVRVLDLSYNPLSYSRTYGKFSSPFLKDYINRMNLKMLSLNGCSLSREQIVDVLESNCLNIEIDWNEMSPIELSQTKVAMNERHRRNVEDAALILTGIRGHSS